MGNGDDEHEDEDEDEDEDEEKDEAGINGQKQRRDGVRLVQRTCDLDAWCWGLRIGCSLCKG
jgi:hypothetical protein